MRLFKALRCVPVGCWFRMSSEWHMHQFIESRNWRATKSVQAFDAAFDDLDANGIVVIHNGPCCDTCVGACLWE